LLGRNECPRLNSEMFQNPRVLRVNIIPNTALKSSSRRYTRTKREQLRLFNPAVYEDARGLKISSSSVTEAEAQGAGLYRPPPQQ